MTETALATVEQPKPPRPRQGEGGPRKRIERRLAIALKAIVHEGLELDQAAIAAGMTTHAVRIALDRPHVITFMRREREVLRAYVSAQNIHHARELRNTSDNAMARLGAMKLIEQLGDESAATAGTSAVRPGVAIYIVTAPAVSAQERGIEAKPLISLDPVPQPIDE